MSLVTTRWLNSSNGWRSIWCSSMARSTETAAEPCVAEWVLVTASWSMWAGAYLSLSCNFLCSLLTLEDIAQARAPSHGSYHAPDRLHGQTPALFRVLLAMSAVMGPGSSIPQKAAWDHPDQPRWCHAPPDAVITLWRRSSSSSGAGWARTGPFEPMMLRLGGCSPKSGS